MTVEVKLELNEMRALSLLQKILDLGINEFCVCPGARNAPLVTLLDQQKHLKVYHWYEERSAAFFALGRIKLTGRPMAVITTSGTAAAELLPAIMEAYYTGMPLLCITADRPRRFRGSGAPQTVEQVGLFGQYVQYEKDLEDEEFFLDDWQTTAPAHLNICFEEPSREDVSFPILTLKEFKPIEQKPATSGLLTRFLEKCSHPFVVVGTLKTEDRESVLQFILRLGAPVFLEGVSGLREDPRLDPLQIRAAQKMQDIDYPLDGVLRIGGVPTFRLWRDLEDSEGKIDVCSINDVPFSGLSWGLIIHTPIASFLNQATIRKNYSLDATKAWIAADRARFYAMKQSFLDAPRSETALVYQLSLKIPAGSMVYLGNSLPIREWDQAATDQNRNFKVFASRGVNGIDGQISTFLGLASPRTDNWALIGDLTALYDMAGFWILSQLKETVINLVVINNGGGKIFEMFPTPVFQNSHQLSFEPLARMWGLDYELWHEIPENIASTKSRLIELVPAVR